MRRYLYLYIPEKYTRNEWKRLKTTLETSGKDEKLRSKRVERMNDYTRNMCILSKTTLVSSVVFSPVSWPTCAKMYCSPSASWKASTLPNRYCTCESTMSFMSLRISRQRWKALPNLDFLRSENYTRNGWRRCKITLEMGGEDAKLHSKWVGKICNYTRFECSFHPLLSGFSQVSGWSCSPSAGSLDFYGELTGTACYSLVDKPETTLETSGEDQNYTRNECRIDIPVVQFQPNRAWWCGRTWFGRIAKITLVSSVLFII
jgi:hypothetical protein